MQRLRQQRKRTQYEAKPGPYKDSINSSVVLLYTESLNYHNVFIYLEFPEKKRKKTQKKANNPFY